MQPALVSASNPARGSNTPSHPDAGFSAPFHAAEAESATTSLTVKKRSGAALKTGANNRARREPGKTPTMGRSQSMASASLQPGQLLARIPIIRRRFNIGTIPGHALRYPLTAPLVVADPAVIIGYPELEPAGWADFIRSTTCVRGARQFIEPDVPAYRAGVPHGPHGAPPGCRSK